MTAGRLRPTRHRALLLTALVLACCPPLVAADDTATVTSTARPPARAPQPAGTVRLESYRGFDRPSPAGAEPARDTGDTATGADRGREPAPGHATGLRPATPMRIDVGVDLATCPDGNLEASAVDAGGWHHGIDDACTHGAAPVHGAVTLHPARSPPATAPGARPPAPQDAPSCDPATWNCRTGGK